MESAASSPVELDHGGRVFGERYRVTCLLKQGHGVATLRGIDLSDDQPVVIKTARGQSLSLGAQMRLEHEAGVLRQVRSPVIAPLLHLGREDDLLYLVMGHVPGITLAERLERGPLSVRETVTLGIALLSALEEVHDQGVLHRDLKPANIIVNDDTPLTQATLIDFGLARSAQLDASIRDQPVGTARYMSPEQAGLLDQDTDDRSDLYSIGVMLFECLAGRPPFLGESVGEVLRQHMTVHPPELRSLGLAIPRALDEIIQRLLRKDPRDRYQSAAAVHVDLTQLALALDRGNLDPALVVGLRDRRRSLTEPAFVGRARELAALDKQINKARRGNGGLVLLEAESGGGKTRLIVELAQRSARQGMWVLRGQGLDQQAQRPFQMLSGVAAQIIAAHELDESTGQSLRARLGDHCEAVCAALPELAAVLRTARPTRLGPESFGEVRSLQALAALLDALGSAERPALVLLDDCQWADELTLKLFDHWRRRHGEHSRGGMGGMLSRPELPGQAPAGSRRESMAPNADHNSPGGMLSRPELPVQAPAGSRRESMAPNAEHNRHVLLAVAFRSEDVPGDHFLRGLQPGLHVTLPPFDTKDVRRLAESMAGPLPAEAIALVEDFSEGSPFMAAAVLQGLVESGALVAEAAGWRVDPLALADVQSSRHAAAFLVHRIEMLPPAVLDLLSAAAVLGKEFDLDIASALANQSSAQAIAAIDEARRRHIVWARSQNTRCTFVHDKLRQTLLARLQPAERRLLHARAALYLEKQDSERLFDLAYHFDAADQSDRALPYALAAAKQARARHSLEIAEQQYRIAARGADSDRTTRFQIAEGLGDVFMLRGRYDQAAEQFETALTLAQGDLAQARLEGKLGELMFKRGEVKSASGRIERALCLLRRRVPTWMLTVIVLVLWEAFVQVLHTLLPRLFVRRRRRSKPEAELLAVRLYSRLAHLYWFHRGTVPALWAHLRGMNLAERYPGSAELAQAYSEHAPGMSLVGYFSRGFAYAEKSLAIRKQLGDVWGQGQSLHFYGVVLYAASRFKECNEKCRAAVRLLERTGDYWEVNIARYQIAASLYRLGDLAGAVAEAQRMHQSGLELGDAQAAGISLDVWARASLGRMPPERIDAEVQRSTGDMQRMAQVLAAKGAWLIYNDRADEAAQVLQQGQDLVDQAGVKNAWVAPVLPWLVTALRQTLEQCSDLTPGRRREILARAAKAAQRALRVARQFQNELPHALRENGLLAAIQGRSWRARRFFEQSLAVAERQGAIYEHAQTMLARGRVGQELCWAHAEEDLEEAKLILGTLEAAMRGKETPGLVAPDQPVTLSLADRFDTVLDSGRRIASALSRDTIFAAVREAALKLLRSERCVLLKVEGEGEEQKIAAASSELSAEFSRTMVRRALAAGRAVAFVEGGADHSSESVLLAHVRSALCAPIFVRGKALCCLYVTHRQVAGLFGADEERLADFVATLAGAALENADGFAELRRLNETLKHQIAESKRAEAQIKEQAALLDKARDAISVVDLEDRILYWNQSSERLYGWSDVEVVGRRSDELLFKQLPPQRHEAKRILLERGEWTGELRQVTRAGQEIIVESRWTLVRDDDGRPKSKLVVSTDITEKKKMETQFLRAQRMESLGTLAGGVAHDINNVLTPIIMAVDLLKSNLPQEHRRAILEELEAGAHRGAEMVKQILAFARGVDGERVRLQLKHVLNDINKMLQRTFPKSITIRPNIAGDLWLVSGDATQLYQMVMNLCVNARDAMPQGGTLSMRAANIHLTEADCRLHPNARPGPHVHITVEDTGTGIPAEIIDKVFDPFFTTKEFGKGTGLGLSTVLGIVKGHGGFLGVSSKPGCGTQFQIYLPAVESGTAKPADETTQILPRGQGELILVVDDEAPIRQVTQKNLEAHGYKVLTAKDGIEAGALYIQHQKDIHLVLTDMAMPRMDGSATIQMLRKLNPRIPVIAASGLKTSLEAARHAGADFQAELVKPFTVDRLLKTVAEVLRVT